MVSTSTIRADTTKYLRDKLAANITDPNSAEHTGAFKFVMTSFPERGVKFPVIIINVTNISDAVLGLGTENRIVTIIFEVDIWGRTVKERDELYDAVYHYLRGNQLGATEAVLGEKLYNFQILSVNNVDEEGIDAPHRTLIQGSYQTITEA